MFFSGMEISNEHFLYQYNIKNDFKIQVMRVPRPKTNEKQNKEGKKEEKKEEIKEENKNEKKSIEDEELINNKRVGREEE